MNGNLFSKKGWVLGVILLPIREAYEWKRLTNVKGSNPCFSCFQFVKRMNGNLQLVKFSCREQVQGFLLPIREAYEWKHTVAAGIAKSAQPLASNSWSVWMETRDWPPVDLGILASNSWSVWMETTHSAPFSRKQFSALLPIREAYEWKLRLTRDQGELVVSLASNSWSVWMETICLALHRVHAKQLASNSWSVWMETEVKAQIIW